MTNSDVGNAVLGLTTTGTVVTVINEWATFISLGLTLLGIIIGLIFHLLNRMDKKRYNEEKMKLMREQIRKEVIDEINKNTC